MGGGILGGFSPCGQGVIATRIASAEADCMTDLPCGDVNESGVVNTTDANIVLQMSSYGGYEDLADVAPNGAPNGLITAPDAQLVLQIAVGTASASVCGKLDLW